MSNLTKVYEQIAITRKRMCTGCEALAKLTHSHIVPRSQEKSLEAVPENITYHCIYCHDIWEHKPDRVFLKDFIPNMIYTYHAAQTFYWKRFFKLEKHWEREALYPIDDKNKDSIKRSQTGRKAMDILKTLSLEVSKL